MVSELVVEEAARGDPVAAAQRLDALRGCGKVSALLTTPEELLEIMK